MHITFFFLSVSRRN